MSRFDDQDKEKRQFVNAAITTGCLIVALLVVVVSARCQDKLPDAPKPQNCVLHKLIGDPGAPSRIHPLTWKQTFQSKTFWALTGIHAAAMLKDEQDTLNGEAQGCSLEQGDHGPYYAHRGDLMKTDLPIFFGVTVGSALLRKTGIPFAWAAMPLTGAGRHAYGSYQWHQVCR